MSGEALTFEVVQCDDLDLPDEIGPSCICESGTKLPEIPLLLEIDAGSAYVLCAVCKKPPYGVEDPSMEPVAVRAHVERQCAHRYGCDCDEWFVLSLDVQREGGSAEGGER